MKRISTPAIRAHAVALREAGKTVPWIARQLGWSAGAIGWWLLLAGAEPPGRPRRPNAPCPTQPRRRGNHVINPYTDDDDRLLLAMAADGLTNHQIGRRLTALDPHRPRTHNSVQGRLLILARREERALMASTPRRAAA